MQKLFLSATSTTTGRLTTLAASLALGLLFCGSAWAAGPSLFSQASGAEVPAPWHFAGLPERYAKPNTAFDITDIDGKKALRIRTDKSYGNMVHDWKGPLATIKWRWRLDVPLLKADLKNKKTEDMALKVCLSFDMPVDNIPVGERTLFRIAQLSNRDKLPTATLCYIWAHAESVGTELASPYTGRVRYIVIDSGEGQLKTWHEHQRNIGADFLKSFGVEMSTVPAVTAIIVGADSDNIEGSSLGYVSDITVQP